MCGAKKVVSALPVGLVHKIGHFCLFGAEEASRAAKQYLLSILFFGFGSTFGFKENETTEEAVRILAAAYIFFPRGCKLSREEVSIFDIWARRKTSQPLIRQAKEEVERLLTVYAVS